MRESRIAIPRPYTTFTMIALTFRLRPSQLGGLFHTSTAYSQDPHHRLYPQINWAKIHDGYFAIVDPLDDEGILYLTEKEYKIQMRVLLTSGEKPKVLARPGDSRIETGPGSQSTTPHSGLKSNRSVTRLWYNAVGSVYRGLSWARGVTMISLTESNLSDFVIKWANKLYLATMGVTRPSGFRLSILYFLRHLSYTLHHQGSKGVVLKLKTSLHYVNSALMGEPIHDPWRLGYPIKVDRRGIPLWLPHPTRILLHQRNVGAIRLWVSLLNMFKAIECPGTPSLDSITSPLPSLSDQIPEFSDFCQRLWRWVGMQSGRGRLTLDLKVEPFPINAAGPQRNPSLLGIARDAFAWSRLNPDLILDWLNLSEENETFRGQYAELAARYRFDFAPFGKILPTAKLASEEPVEGPLRLGKLALKYEAAGKVRVFALVDWWTQVMLRPVHDWMFRILKYFPGDATFDQEQALKSFVSAGHKDIYSFDLKSATDMIPQTLYRVLFSAIWGEHVTDLWLRLLVDRDYVYFPDPSDKSAWHTVRYTRGQPMGALSSWASLALLHHALVLFAAAQTGKPFSWDAYRVLGDDVVIAGSDVAEAYLEVCRVFSIPVGLPKSYVSHEGGLNFANQTYMGNVNISPWSVREELAVRGPSSRLEMVFRAIRRGWIGTLTEPKFMSRLMRLFLSPHHYTKVCKDLVKGRLSPIGAMTLTLSFLPVVPRLRSLGIEAVSLGLPSLCRDTGFLGMGPAIARGQVGCHWEVAFPVAFALVRQMLSHTLRVIDRNQRSLSSLMDWFETSSLYPSEVYAFRLFITKSYMDTRDVTFRVRDRLEEILAHMEAWTPLDRFLPSGDMTEEYLDALSEFSKVSTIPRFDSEDPFDVENISRDRTVQDLHRYQDLMIELGYELQLGSHYADLEPFRAFSPRSALTD